jgi:putative SOS response-associated peptidase YedK
LRGDPFFFFGIRECFRELTDEILDQRRIRTRHRPQDEGQPSLSKEPKVKFATHKATLDTIEEKATWRGPFKKAHCLVPIQSFLEPIYTGEFSGNIVAFQPRDKKIMLAAGIYRAKSSCRVQEMRPT